jgi:hypothetical protein
MNFLYMTRTFISLEHWNRKRFNRLKINTTEIDEKNKGTYYFLFDFKCSYSIFIGRLSSQNDDRYSDSHRMVRRSWHLLLKRAII